MVKFGLICHSVVALAMVMGTQAHAFMCSELFNTPEIEQIDFKNAGQQMRNMLLSKSQLQYYSPKTENQVLLALQVPLILKSLLSGLDAAKNDLSIKERFGKEPLLRPKEKLAESLDQSFERLNVDASRALENKRVTYEWFMDFFMRSIILSDVTARVSDKANKESYEILIKKLDYLLERSNSIYISDTRTMLLYTSLGKKYANSSRANYFEKYAKKDPVIPVLFVPRDQDVVTAQNEGYHFLSFTEGKTMTIEGPKFPMEFAGLQMEQTLRDIRIKEDADFSKGNIFIFNNSLAYKINGKPKLQALHAFLLRDAGLQGEIAKRVRQGFVIMKIPFEAHQVSIFLKKYLKLHEQQVSKIADPEAVEEFLHIVYGVEKGILARQLEQ